MRKSKVALIACDVKWGGSGSGSESLEIHTQEWYFSQCSEVEYIEIVPLPARTGGQGWSKKDYG